jgi:hypothetical protein
MRIFRKGAWITIPGNELTQLAKERIHRALIAKDNMVRRHGDMAIQFNEKPDEYTVTKVGNDWRINIELPAKGRRRKEREEKFNAERTEKKWAIETFLEDNTFIGLTICWGNGFEGPYSFIPKSGFNKDLETEDPFWWPGWRYAELIGQDSQDTIPYSIGDLSTYLLSITIIHGEMSRVSVIPCKSDRCCSEIGENDQHDDWNWPGETTVTHPGGRNQCRVHACYKDWGSGMRCGFNAYKYNHFVYHYDHSFVYSTPLDCKETQGHYY